MQATLINGIRFINFKDSDDATADIKEVLDISMGQSPRVTFRLFSDEEIGPVLKKVKNPDQILVLTADKQVLDTLGQEHFWFRLDQFRYRPLEEEAEGLFILIENLEKIPLKLIYV